MNGRPADYESAALPTELRRPRETLSLAEDAQGSHFRLAGLTLSGFQAAPDMREAHETSRSSRRPRPTRDCNHGNAASPRSNQACRTACAPRTDTLSTLRKADTPRGTALKNQRMTAWALVVDNSYNEHHRCSRTMLELVWNQATDEVIAKEMRP